MNKKEHKMKLSPSELAGWVGMVFIHSATVPATVGNIMGWSDNLPPVSMVFMVWVGLVLFLWRAFGRNDMLYIVSNAVGFALNSILLALIVFPLA